MKFGIGMIFAAVLIRLIVVALPISIQRWLMSRLSL